MKRRFVSFVVCVVMVLSMMLMPVSALASSGKYMTVTSNVHLRSTTNVNNIITTLKRGTTVWFTGKKQKAFYEVKTSKGKVGYVFKMYLKDVTDSQDGIVYRVKSETTLYKKASTDSKRICRLEEGRYLLVLSTGDGWAHVKTTTDKKGYVQTSKLKKP